MGTKEHFIIHSDVCLCGFYLPSGYVFLMTKCLALLLSTVIKVCHSSQKRENKAVLCRPWCRELWPDCRPHHLWPELARAQLAFHSVLLPSPSFPCSLFALRLSLPLSFFLSLSMCYKRSSGSKSPYSQGTQKNMDTAVSSLLTFEILSVHSDNLYLQSGLFLLFTLRKNAYQRFTPKYVLIEYKQY